jgi:hypothetical protein
VIAINSNGKNFHQALNLNSETLSAQLGIRIAIPVIKKARQEG